MRSCQRIYWLMIITGCVVVANIPLITVSFTLIRDPSNLIIAALAAVPLGPSLVAMLACLQRLRQGREDEPVRDFLRSYRANVLATCAFWAPAMMLLAALALDLTILNRSSRALDAAMFVVVLVLAALILLWLANMLAITAGFSFRLRDASRLAVFYLFRSPQVALGHLAIMFLVGALVYATSDWAVGLGAGLFGYLAVLNSSPMLSDLKANYVQVD